MFPLAANNKAQFMVFSNNPLVWNALGEDCIAITGGALNVLYACLNDIALGTHSLYAHPIAGNARLLHNPFRSVILEKRAVTREEQRMCLRLLEYFIVKLENMDGAPPPQTHHDYEIIDCDLLLHTFQSMSLLTKECLCGTSCITQGEHHVRTPPMPKMSFL